MPEWSSEETQQLLADLADPLPTAAATAPPADPECTSEGHDHTTSSCRGPLPLLAANLGLASTRELLEELEARGILLGGYDGRQMVNVIAPWLRSPTASLSAHVLEYRTVDIDAPPAPDNRWRDRLVASESGFYTADECTEDCRINARHVTPKQAMECRARRML